MEKLTFDEFLKKTEELDISDEDFYNFVQDYGFSTDPSGEALEFLKSLGEIKSVEEQGGGEGGGSEHYEVYHLVDQGFYVKVEGYYSSYNGTNWPGDSFEEVHPVTKTVTVYE